MTSADSAAVQGGDPGEPHGDGLARSATLFRMHLRESEEPAAFYNYLAADTLEQIDRLAGPLAGPVLDVGGGAGYLARAVAARGVDCVVIEAFAEELRLHGNAPTSQTVIGDGRRLPFGNDTFRLVHCSNVLEHVPGPDALLQELVRVLRPGGTGYLSFTPWYSPWGGHETSPWHFFGGEYAVRRYERRSGERAKNRFGSSLFIVRSRDVIAALEGDPRIDVRWAGPRYWPSSWSRLSTLPIIGELLTWNQLIVFTRRGDP